MTTKDELRRGIGCFVLILLSCVVLHAQSVSQAPCHSYEPATVSLNGIIKRHIFPGPPNFESVKKGDQPEQVWVLHLSSPICVSASSDFDAQSNVSDFQLVLPEGQKQYDRYRSLVGKRVEVTGALFQASTGHHHTKALLTVSGISALLTQSTKTWIGD